MKNKYTYIGVIIFLLMVSCDKKEITSKDKGYSIYIKHACNTCHSLDGSRMNGPTFKDIYGKKVYFYNDDFAIVDEQYLINSIVSPDKEIVKGYPNLMPSYDLEKDEIDALIDFIKKQ